MSQLVPVVHNFIGNNNVPKVGNALKSLLLIGSAMGADRLNLIISLGGVFKFVIRMFALILNITILIISVFKFPSNLFSKTMLIFCLIQHYLLAVFALAYRDSQKSFLASIYNFDTQYRKFGFRRLNQLESEQPVKLLLVISAAFTTQIISNILLLVVMKGKYLISLTVVMLSRLCQSTELSVYREFLSLINNRMNVLSTRLREINSESSNITFSKQDVHSVLNCEFLINRIQTAYKQMVEASKLLKYSLKWQIATTVVIDFVPRLLTWYMLTLVVVSERFTKENRWIYCLCVMCSEIASAYLQIILGVVCDQINAKEEGLKVILAHHLGCSSLGKEGRRLMCAFMALLNRKGLSFKLLGVANIGVRLVVQGLSLTLTCLIILMQFGKLVENPLIRRNL